MLEYQCGGEAHHEVNDAHSQYTKSKEDADYRRSVALFDRALLNLFLVGGPVLDEPVPPSGVLAVRLLCGNAEVRSQADPQVAECKEGQKAQTDEQSGHPEWSGQVDCLVSVERLRVGVPLIELQATGHDENRQEDQGHRHKHQEGLTDALQSSAPASQCEGEGAGENQAAQREANEVHQVGEISHADTLFRSHRSGVQLQSR